jgi:glycine hydroxymethyltransferase
VDVVEQIAIDRAKNCLVLNMLMCSHSGSQANTAVFFACLKPGDKILGFDSHGGHLTRFSVNFSGRLYSPVFYGVDAETGRLDYDKIQEISNKEQPN